MSTLAGSRVGSVELGACLGFQGPAEVYQVEGAQEATVRVLPEELRGDPAFLASFRRYHARPDSPSVQEADPEKGPAHSLGPALEARSLEVELAERLPRAPHEALRLATEVLETLAHGHRRGLYGPTLDPGEVLVDRFGHPLLRGFRTPGDARSDLQAFAALTRTLLRGAPDNRAEAEELLSRHLQGGSEDTLELFDRFQEIGRRNETVRIAAPRPTPEAAQDERASAPLEAEALSARPAQGPRRRAWSQGLALAAVLGALGLGLLLDARAPKLLEVAKDVETQRCEVHWRTDAPSYSFIEFYTHEEPERRRRTRPSPEAGTEFHQPLEGLRADTKYFFRFGFSPSDTGADPHYSRALEFKTRPKIEIRDIQVVDRKHDRVTIRWVTNLETDTKVRIGQTRDYSRIVENPEQRRELDHSIVIHGLKGNTTYHYQIVASDPDNSQQEVTSDDKRLVTRAEAGPVSGEGRVDNRVRSYVERLARLTPAERRIAEASLEDDALRFEDLGPEELREMVATPSTPANFHRRRWILELWVEDLAKSEKPLPEGLSKPGTTLREEAPYLRSLFEVNAPKAITRLDRSLKVMAEASGLGP